MSETNLDIGINPAGTVSGAGTINRIVDQVKNNFIDLSAKVFVAQQALNAAWSAGRQGAEFNETMDRLNRQMSSFGSNANAMVSSMQRVTGGQLSMAQASVNASRALAVGLNPNQVVTFAQAAEALSDVTGQDIPNAFDSLVQAAITGRGAVLANIGVYVDLNQEIQKLAVSTNRTTEQITRQERAMLAAKAITEQADGAMRKLSDGNLSDADKIRALSAAWEDLWTGITAGASKALIPVIEFGKAATDAFRFMTDPQFRENEKNKDIPKFGEGKPLPSEGSSLGLQSSALDAQRQRVMAAIQADYQRQAQSIQALSQLVDLDTQRGLATQEDAVHIRGDLRLRELKIQREGIEQELAQEIIFHERRKQLGFDTTEAKIAEENKFKAAFQDIQDKIRAIENDTTIAERKNEADRDIARRQAEQQRGDRVSASLRSEFEIREAMRQRDFEGEQTYYRGQIELANALFQNDSVIAGAERQLLREQLAFKLRLTKDEIDQMLRLRQEGNVSAANAIRDRGDAALTPAAREGLVASGTANDILLAERASGDFFQGWARGMQGYIRDTQTGFGLARDMSRRTAQTMESGFQQFFFSPFEAGTKGMLENLGNMTKQIFSQIAAQMVTSGLLQILSTFAGGGSGSFSSFFALQASRNVSNVKVGGSFANGGTGDFGSGSLAMLHNREAVVPLPDGRSIPVSLGSSASASGVNAPLVVNIVNQHSGAQVEAQQRRNSNTGDMELEILVSKAVNKSIQQGQMDKSMRSRFGLVPGER